MKRRVLVKLLVEAGFVPVGGTKHEKFLKGTRIVLVKRHREIEDVEAWAIMRQAGLR